VISSKPKQNKSDDLAKQVFCNTALQASSILAIYFGQ